MHRTTAWSHSSSLTSDRLTPSSRPASSQSNSKGKVKGKSSEPVIPKSVQVRKLESLLAALRDLAQSPKKDPKGGCFCQAREHSLSSYTPICRTCGLILCDVNQPQFACPHCLTSLVAGNIRDSLITRIQAQLDETVAREMAARERAIEAAKQEAGAFPMLSGAIPPSQKLVAPQPRTHKVLSVNSKSKKVSLSSYTTTPASSRPSSRSEVKDEEAAILRISPPPSEVVFAQKDIDQSRPWSNLLGGNPVYIALPTSANASTNRSRRRKGKDNAAMGQRKDATASAAS
ncbi:hypothetical protein FB446DRAFT_733609 [Lentinula raphanica]|nr:hypothetical protein FB446DRAFT_733609 [Lentinula raphanica]